MKEDKIIKLFEKRKMKYPDFYSDQIKRIVKNINGFEIEDTEKENIDYNVRDAINIIRNFLNDLDPKMLNVFNNLISKDAIVIERDLNKDESGMYFFDFNLSNKSSLNKLLISAGEEFHNIYVNSYNIESLLHMLSHEVGHAIDAHFSNNYIVKEKIETETISQLIPRLLNDYLNKEYPRLDISSEENMSCYLVFSGLDEIDDYVNLFLYNDSSNIKKSKFKEDSEEFEYNLVYIYSYLLSDELYKDYLKSNSLNKIYKMIELSHSKHNINSILKELDFNRQSIGTKSKILEIKKRIN